MPATVKPNTLLNPSDTFVHRHLGPSDRDIDAMLSAIGCRSMKDLIESAVPSSIRMDGPLQLGGSRGEYELLAELRGIAEQNEIFRSMIGMGYHDCILPPVIQRNILENPGWYTQYTPYQAEISQGRLEALVNFQTMVADLTALPLANSSLLDEGTAAAEAMTMCRSVNKKAKADAAFFIATDCHPQTIAVVQTRAKPLGIEVDVGRPEDLDFAKRAYFGVLLQYPTTDGRVCDYADLADRAHAADAMVVVAADLLALTLLRPPGEFGADIAVGSAQRFGVPLGFGGPHAGYMTCREEYKRRLPGRVIGVSKDAQGHKAYRLAIQTREQHIRREKATSNICTAQVLLAILAAMYATYHGPTGLRRIAERVHAYAVALAAGLKELGCEMGDTPFFDTLRVRLGPDAAKAVIAAARERRMNLRDYGDGSVGVSVDETTTREDVTTLLEAFNGGDSVSMTVDELLEKGSTTFAKPFAKPLSRTSPYLTHPVFNQYHCETDMLRYIYKLQQRDLSLATSMIPLGSCTMKLNATSEMMPITWPEFGSIHPFAPADQWRGYATMIEQLEDWLAEITGFAAVSVQPNAGSQGEFAGLMVIRAYHEGRGEGDRNICLIPESAHGTNPASSVTAGLKVVVVKCDEQGNIDVEDLLAKATEHSERLAALMVTYPSTHGVFEEAIRDICNIVHEHGGQVYLDGANMNAQVGLCRPGDYGGDVCHLNLHKTFSIPHGGGGPGVGPIGVASHLAPFLPGHPEVKTGGEKAIGPVSAAPYGSPSVLPISWMYIALMGGEGLTKASEVSILNANYMAKRLEGHYPVVYTGKNGRVAHEFIMDARQFKESAGIEVEDIAKRLMDYGFHAPTMSFPVPGTLMIEPTESEPKAEMDRFCDALISIRAEIRAIEEGRADKLDNVLKNSPHSAAAVATDDWSHPYSRDEAAYPAAWVREQKFWPPVGRIDNVWGDRNLFCLCPPVDGGGE